MDFDNRKVYGDTSITDGLVDKARLQDYKRNEHNHQKPAEKGNTFTTNSDVGNPEVVIL